MVWTFGHVLVKVHEDSNCEHDVNKNVAVQLINQSWNVRPYPLIFFCTTLKVNAPIIVDISFMVDRLRKSIDASVTFATSASLMCEMVFWMSHVLVDLLTQSVVSPGQFCFNDFTDFV